MRNKKHTDMKKAIIRTFAVSVVLVSFVHVYLPGLSLVDTEKKASTGILIPFIPTRRKLKELRSIVEKCACKIYEKDKLSKANRLVLDKHTFHEEFKQVVNDLAATALIDGMEYLVLVVNESSLPFINADQIKHSMKRLKHHIASDVGVIIVSYMKTSMQKPHLITVHKSHIKVFHQFFPNYIDSTSSLQWIKYVYKPYHCVELSASKPYDAVNLSIPFQFSERNKDGNLETDKNKINDFIKSTRSLLVISYSLYGSNSRYTDGAIANTILFKTIYPGWKLWIYHDNTVPLFIMSKICKKVNVTCINMTESFLPNKMTWRFLIASVPFVSRYVIRDIDSRLSEREKAAVDEWIVSGKKFHVMRDHPAHGVLPINGGMWGGTREAIPQLEALLRGTSLKDTYITDMKFLNGFVWNIAKTSVYQHDSFFCKKFGGGHPFPTKRIGLEHVGSVYINGIMRKNDLIMLNNTQSPKECILT